MIVKGSKGTIYELEQNPFSSGGEGSIYGLPADHSKVAKIYHKGTATREVESKILYMVKNQPDPSVLNQIAWPLDLVFDQGGKFCGFVMPRLNITTVLSDVYKYPPKYSISFKAKLILAQNICTVIREIHKAGYIFGDFNPRNIGVNLKSGKVAFLDTDSYHIVLDRAAGKAYRCNVCAPGYAAPELLGKCYDHIARHPADAKCAYEKTPLDTFTKETDNFALAIHIFRLLNNGFTPFNGIDETDTASVAAPGVGDAAVWRDSYCFKKGKKPLAKAVPPLDAHPSYIGEMFTKAFVQGRKDPTARPNASDWYQSLVRYEKEIQVCSRNGLHMYRKGLASCPWCEANAKYRQILSDSANQKKGNHEILIRAPKASPVGTAVAPVVAPVSISRSAAPNSGAALCSRQMIRVTPSGFKDIASILMLTAGWLLFIYCIIHVGSPLIRDVFLHLNEEKLGNINVTSSVHSTLWAVALLCFGSHFTRMCRGLADVAGVVWGGIFCFSLATVYYVQLGYSAASAGATWKFFGSLLAVYGAVMAISIILGEWLSHIGPGKQTNIK